MAGARAMDSDRHSFRVRAQWVAYMSR
jgi:hypothetical protein